MHANAHPAVDGLRAARLRAGLTQERLAVAAGCSGGYVRLLERGFAPEHSAVLPRLLAVIATEADRRTAPVNDDGTAANGPAGEERDDGAQHTE